MPRSREPCFDGAEYLSPMRHCPSKEREHDEVEWTNTLSRLSRSDGFGIARHYAEKSHAGNFRADHVASGSWILVKLTDKRATRGCGSTRVRSPFWEVTVVVGTQKRVQIPFRIRRAEVGARSDQ